MIQQEFNLTEGQQRRDDGIAIAESNHPSGIEIAKQVAKELAEQRGEITADDVQAEMHFRGINLCNAAGGIFRGKQWEWTGRVVKSARISNHARILRVWKLKEV